jgi:hypothetical protein
VLLLVFVFNLFRCFASTVVLRRNVDSLLDCYRMVSNQESKTLETQEDLKVIRLGV